MINLQYEGILIACNLKLRSNIGFYYLRNREFHTN